MKESIRTQGGGQYLRFVLGARRVHEGDMDHALAKKQTKLPKRARHNGIHPKGPEDPDLDFGVPKV